MAEPTQADVDRAKRITDTIETCRIRLTKIATSLTALSKAGKVTCEELRAYNLWAMSIYAENNAQLALARASGTTGLPLRAPSPALFAYRGMAGEQAGNFPCGTPLNGLNGALTAALAAPSRGVFLPPDSVDVIPAGSDVSIARGPSLRQIQTQLGFPFAVLFICAAVTVVATAAIIMSFNDRWREEEITEKTVTVSANNLKVFETSSSLRANCIVECTGTGQKYDQCAKSCASAFPMPQSELPGGGANADSSIGLLGWVLIGAGLLVGGRFVYKRWGGSDSGGTAG